MRSFWLLVVLFMALSLSGRAMGVSKKPNIKSSFVMESLQDSLAWADYYYNIHRYGKAIPLYEKSLENEEAAPEHIIKKLALSQAALDSTDASISYIYDYLREDFNPTFLLHEGFDGIRETEKFQGLSTAIIPKINPWSVVYFVVALIGFYVTLIILLNRKVNWVARYLISAFLFIHSFFILNIAINMAHYLFEYPHTYLMSTWGSLLYGPLLYFYFKRISQKYVFRPLDTLHLIPTIMLLGYMLFSVYLLSADDKIDLLLGRLQYGLTVHDSNQLVLVVSLKTISLGLYAYFIRKVYLDAKTAVNFDQKTKIWQKNVYQIHISYVIIYAIYGVLIINQQINGVVYHASIAAMAMMVLYIGYSANIQPHVFGGIYSYTNRLFPKYEKSGLTPSLSNELRENLERLLCDDKIYRENNLSLEILADKLNTTRHNASQVINEHFQISFHELVNKYRIEEAKEILTSDNQASSIIEVAYEVGYNNKVTFNKAFKKDTKLTPSEYIRMYRSA